MISIVVPVYNSPVETQQMLESLSTVRVPHEVILVDDKSEAATIQVLEDFSRKNDHVQLILNNENRGFAKNCNLGASKARYEILAFLNNDLILYPNWLEPMLEILNRVADCGVVGNIQISQSTRKIDHAGMFFHPDGLPRQARKGCSRRPSGTASEWRCVSAACMLIRRSVFEKSGGFDEGYRNGCEDVDLCLRLHSQGYRHFVSNHSTVGHHVSMAPGRHRFNDHNQERFISRWADLTQAWAQEEWAREYFRIYAAKPWKMTPALIPSLLAGLFKKHTYPRELSLVVKSA